MASAIEVVSTEFLKKYPLIWNKDTWDELVDDDEFTLPFNLDPSELCLNDEPLEYAHGTCPPELTPFVTGSFFIDNIKQFKEPFEAEFATMFDACEYYYFKWDGKKLYRAIIDYSSALEQIAEEDSEGDDSDDDSNSYEMWDDSLNNGYSCFSDPEDEKYKKWELIYES